MGALLSHTLVLYKACDGKKILILLATRGLGAWVSHTSSHQAQRRKAAKFCVKHCCSLSAVFLTGLS